MWPRVLVAIRGTRFGRGHLRETKEGWEGQESEAQTTLGEVAE